MSSIDTWGYFILTVALAEKNSDRDGHLEKGFVPVKESENRGMLEVSIDRY
jgi:hypothetical protein